MGNNKQNYKVSIITVVMNSERTIEDAILSVSSQDYSNIEYIIVDGASEDNTLAIIEKHSDKVQLFVSEPDGGMYEAMNKGIKIASGDVIGILNSDDIYKDEGCISSVVRAFEVNNVSAVCGSLVYVSPDNLNKVKRYYCATGFKPFMFGYGMMPPHPSFFVKKSCYNKFGYYKTDYNISADFELLARFISTHGISYSCISKVLVKMRMGGISTQGIKSNLMINQEIIRACKENNISTNIFKILSKYFVKLFQLIRKPSNHCRDVNVEGR